MDQAIGTAMTLFHRRGYDAVGVAELVKALGIRPPSFYAAFGSKAGLLRRAFDRYTEGEANVFARAREKGGGVVEVIGRTLLNAAACYPERDGAAGCLVLDGARDSIDPEARALGAGYREAARGGIRDFIATEFPARADDLAALVTIALAGMSAAARDGAGAATLRTFAEAAGRAFRREAESA